MILFAQPKEWWLEISPSQQTLFWEKSQQHIIPNSRFNAYINRACLYALLELIQDDVESAHIWLDDEKMSAVWDVVNGSAITIDTKKLIIIPTEEIDDQQLEVPQEWVDIPSWVGDYYIVVQFRPDGNYLRVWGYTTHQELKNNSCYNPNNRTYCLDASHLTRDMDTLWVRYECYPDDSTRADVSLLALPVTQAENLIERLGNAAVVFPRLSVPFVTWGALLENEQWRQTLYTTRQGIQRTRLSEWLKGKINTLWQKIEDTSVCEPATAFRSHNAPNLTPQPQNSVFTIKRVKILNFSSVANSKQIILLVGISPINDMEMGINVEVLPVDNFVYLPNDIQVRLLNENNNELAKANAEVTQTIQFEFGGQVNEKFSIEVACGSKILTEYFEI